MSKSASIFFSGGRWKQIIFNLNDNNGDYLADTVTSDDGTMLEPVGNPSLGTVTEIRLGVINNTGLPINNGKLWVNEIHLADAQNRKGRAGRIQFNTTYKEWASLAGSFRIQDRNFETIGKKSAGQESTIYSLDPKITYLKYLPITGQ